MKILFSISLATFLFVSCKKDNIQPTKTDTVDIAASDSISFKLNDQAFSFTSFGEAFGYKQINIKPYSTKRQNQIAAYQTGNIWYYGSTDSLLTHQNISFSGESGHVEIMLSKKYNIGDLIESAVFFPRKGYKYELGDQQFMTDLGGKNTTEGIYIKLDPINLTKLTSQSPLDWKNIQWNDATPDNTVQKDSKFTVIKFEKLEDNRFLLEANFEVNMYSEKNKKYRITEGFLRFHGQTKPLINQQSKLILASPQVNG